MEHDDLVNDQCWRAMPLVQKVDGKGQGQLQAKRSGPLRGPEASEQQYDPSSSVLHATF
jgi:hypothetical protein